MARVTVEDCLRKVNNHFDLILVATLRAKEIIAGQQTNAERSNNSAGVIALREIADGMVDVTQIKEKLLSYFAVVDNTSKTYSESTADVEVEKQKSLIIESDQDILVVDSDSDIFTNLDEDKE